jgi:hypothetical protein
MIYTVYKLFFFTRKGSRREYVGYTGQIATRMAFHKRKPPAWVKCRKAGAELKFRVLEKDVASKNLALALEAYHACRAIAAKPHAARGGPWVRPTLPDVELGRIRVLAGMSLRSLLEYGAAKRSKLLHEHLAELRFGRLADAPIGAATARGVYVAPSRSGRSGVCGRKARSARMRRGLVAGSDVHVQLKRGTQPQARRRAENLKQKARRARMAKRARAA